MDLETLKLFVQLAELGSMTKVAIAQDAPQSGISRRVTALEHMCGARLFHRTGRGVAPTDFAELILPKVKALLADVEQLSHEMKSGAGVLTGSVRIGILPSLSSPTVQTLFEQVREKYPGVQLHILEGSNGQIDEWVSSGRVDIGVVFRYGGSIWPAEQALGTVETYLVSAPGDKLTAGESIDFAQLHNVPLILPGAPNGLRAALEHVALRMGVALKVVIEADSLALQKQFAADGNAYAILGGHAITAEVDAGLLQAARIANGRMSRTVVLTSTTQRPMSHARREVAKMLRHVLDDLFASATFR